MHKERIIAGIEKLFESYARDERLKEALKETNFPFQLFPTYSGESYFLAKDGTIQYTSMNDRSLRISSSLEAAQTYYEYLHFYRVHPLTLTKAKARLKKDLSKEIKIIMTEAFGHFDPCDRPRELRSGLRKDL